MCILLSLFHTAFEQLESNYCFVAQKKDLEGLITLQQARATPEMNHFLCS